MKFKKIVPYFLAATAFLSSNALASYTNETNPRKVIKFELIDTVSGKTEAEYDLQKQIAENKAIKLVTNYIDNAINGVNHILASKKKTSYPSAVRKELPGAPVNSEHTLHCLYGQYTQLNRAITELGDTIQIIPKTDNAHMATSSFRRHMTKLYKNEEYPNSIYSGHLYSTDKEYNKALDRYLAVKTKGKTENIDSLRAKYTADFEKNNFCASSLNPGSIIIVSSGHAIMYLGQGRIENNQFVPDANGTAICCSYNAEQPATCLSTWNTDKAFAADIQNIATTKYYAMATKTR